jgi:hypothetical protein
VPFDLDSFLDDTGTPFPASAKVDQQQFHLLNNIISGTNPPLGVTELQKLWYSSTTSTVPFTLNQGAAQLPLQPFIHHEPLYDSVVKIVCRSCHVAIPGKEWDTFSQMSDSAPLIQFLVCGGSSGPMTMPHAQVPWLRFWQQNLSATLASELAFKAPGCPPS